MPLPTGSRLGVYEILSPLGAGGMGEVYRARDTKLGRDVALKVLPEALRTDRDRLDCVSADGKRLLVIRGERQAASAELELTVNWFQDLRRAGALR